MTYNGWSNFETWKVNCEAIGCTEPRDLLDESEYESRDDYIYDLAESLKEMVEEILSSEQPEPQGLLDGFARAFLANVNWREIAESLAEDVEIGQSNPL